MDGCGGFTGNVCRFGVVMGQRLDFRTGNYSRWLRSSLNDLFQIARRIVSSSSSINGLIRLRQNPGQRVVALGEQLDFNV